MTATRKRILACSLTLWTILAVSAATGQEWTRFRGPNGQGIADAKTIPVKWTEQDYNWKTELPGGGHSSPVIWGEKVFVTCGDQKTSRALLLALRASDGEILWRCEQTLSAYRFNPLNSLATGTPAVDADCVYAVWPSPTETVARAVNHAGKEVWTVVFPGARTLHGPGISAVVVNDLVVFPLEQKENKEGVQGAWIALDRRTGKERWKCERDASANESYSTPCLYPDANGAVLVFTSFAYGITGVDSRTGAVVWERKSALPKRVVSSPVIAGDLVIGSCGQASAGERLIAIRPGERDESGQPKEVYQTTGPIAPYVPTSLAKDGLLFTFHDRGDAACLDAATGKQLWCEKSAGKIFGSPVWVDGRLYCITTAGEVVVMRAAAQYELLAVNPLGEKSHATPAVAGGRMYLRTWSHVISIGGK